MTIGPVAAWRNRNAGWLPDLPGIEVAHTKVYGYIEHADDGLRVVASVHLAPGRRRIPAALLRDRRVPLRITVNGDEVFAGLVSPVAAVAAEAPSEHADAARFNSEALRLPGSGWDPLGDGDARLPCIEVAGVQIYGYVEDFVDGLRLVVSLHLDGDIAPELLRGDLVPVRIAVNAVQVFAA
jgi:hypothetical protein